MCTKPQFVASLSRCLTLICLFGLFSISLVNAVPSSAGGPVITTCEDYLHENSVDINGNPSVIISPNPFSEYFQITTTVKNNIQHITILDANGTVLTSEDWTGSCALVDGTSLPAGVYTVLVSTNYVNISAIVIKED